MLYLSFNRDVEPVSVQVAGRDVPVHRNRDSFSIGLFGMGDKETDLQLTLKDSSSISFWLMDQSIGLPGQIRPRPSNFIAGEGSDVTMICRQYSL